MMLYIFCVVLLLCSCFVNGFLPLGRRSAFGDSALRMADDQFSALEQKLKAKTASTAKPTAPAKSTPNPASPAKTTASTPAKATTPAPKKEAPAAKAPPVVAPKPVAAPSAPVATKSVDPTPATALSGGEIAAGIGLGLTPYLLLPAVVLGAAKGLLKTPKPLPVQPEKKPKVNPYSKSLGEGAQEGIQELLSGKVTEELELTRKGIKLVGGAFGIAGALAGAYIAVSPKSSAPPAPVTKTSKPTPAPAPAPAPKPAPAPAPAPAPKPAPAPEPKPAPAPAPAPAPKPAPATAPAPAPEPSVQEFVPKTVPKGMEPDVVDLEKLKMLRKK